MDKKKLNNQTLSKAKEKPRDVGSDYSPLLIQVIRILVYISLFAPLIVVSNFFFPFVAPKSLFFMGITQILFAAYVLLIIIKPEFRPKLNFISISLISYLAILILTTLTGVNPSMSFWANHERMTGLLMWLHLVAYFLVLSSVFKTQPEWSKVFTATLTASNIVALIFLFVRFGLYQFPMSQDASTIGNSSFMGVYLLFNAFIAIYLVIKSSDYPRYYYAVSLVLHVLALFISAARASQASFIGGILLISLLYLVFKSGSKWLRLAGTAFLSISFVAVIVSIIFLFVPDSFMLRLFAMIDGNEARSTVWSLTLQGISERFFLGWGPENFSAPFMKHFDPRLFLNEFGGVIWYDRAHNILFDTLITSGLVGLLSYFLIFISTFFMLLKKFLSKKVDFWTMSIFSVILVAYFIQNLTVFDMVNSLLMFMLVLAFSTSATFESKPAQVPQRKKLTPLAITPVVIALALCFAFFVIMPYRSGLYVARSNSPANFAQLLTFYRTAIDSSPIGREIKRSHFADQFLGFYVTPEGQQANQDYIVRVFTFLETELQKSIEKYPLFYRTYINLSNLYSAWFQIDPSKVHRAIRVLGQAIELSPRNQTAHMHLVQAYVHLRDFEKALEIAQHAVDLEPRFLGAHIVMVEVAKASGNIELAEQKISDALEINPEWETRLREIVP